MDTQDREKYRQLRQQQRERQLHIIRLSILLGVGVILMFTGLGLLTYVHQQKQTATSGNVSERFSEAASSAALETASRNDLDTETAAATEKAHKKKKKQSQTTDVSETTPVSAGDYLGLLQQQSADLPKLKKILKDPSRYPKSLLKALSKSIGDDFVTGEIPALIQWDERWGYAPYGSETIIAVSGCGPTALSMVISGLLQDASITPAVVADYASSNGYLDENLDTKWELMTNGVEHFGLSGSILGLDENAMINVLSVGCPIICSMGPGIFTTTGHFIVLTGYQDGAFTVHDPASKVRTSQTYTFQEISGQIKNMWYFAKN